MTLVHDIHEGGRQCGMQRSRHWIHNATSAEGATCCAYGPTPCEIYALMSTWAISQGTMIDIKQPEIS